MGPSFCTPKFPRAGLSCTSHRVFPSFVAGLVLAALVSAIMSSADAVLLSAGTILSVDVIGASANRPQKKGPLICPLGASGYRLAALGLAWFEWGHQCLAFAYTIYTSG